MKCKQFSPIRPVLSSYQNNRDHRKICVIDGKVAFTGGINLADEYIKIVVKYEITSKTTLGDNDHLTVKKGYVFPNGHITTSEEEGMFDKHENGHEFYNRCIKFEEISKKGQFECTIKLNAEWSQKEKDEALRNAIANELKIIEIPLIEDKVNEAQNKIDAMVYRFHKDHGVGGSSDNYTCPTN